MSDDAMATYSMPRPRHITLRDLGFCLRAGWADFRAAPLYGLAFASVYVLAGWMIVWALSVKGQLWWTLPISAGFPILGPFVACGFYEISRRREQGIALNWRGVMGVIFAQKNRQIPSMAAVIVIFFLFWNFLAHMIFALFLGTVNLTNITSSFEVFLTVRGMLMLLVGTGVGAAIAFLLFSLTTVSLPLLLDREVDFVTAMISSVALVQKNFGVMPVWAAMIGAAMFLAMIPLFLGLFLVLPVFGHASWHLYRIGLD